MTSGPEGRRGPGRATPAGATTPAGPTSIRVVALDLDGVVWRGGEVLPGVVEALADVVGRGLDLRYVSNNSTAHREAVSERLAGLGLPAGAGRVLTSGSVTGSWLRERLPEGAPVLVVGEDGLVRELVEAGLAAYRTVGGREIASKAAAARPGAAEPAAAGPAAVVVGMDREFDYEVLAAAQRAIGEGALFVATNRDATFPTPQGLLPGAGAIVAAVATAAKTEPVLMGKPGLALAEALAVATGAPAAQTLFVGDRMSTDIAMGRAAGMVTVMVLTGVTSAADLERAKAAGQTALPDHVLPGLADLPGLLDRLTIWVSPGGGRGIIGTA